jgi:hypothetical protein
VAVRPAASTAAENRALTSSKDWRVTTGTLTAGLTYIIDPM